ncbi:LuxR C-terminal-related transcriptional regulator [Dichotomicrobium thermohalophilum]|uniref:Regulatory LuxR family protein n=1 Tax=Dichotomicrobium thermohalophilum TaxID=933063 RepID=A0A397Q8C0_9HYPH|nr:LuxR C-terminal-related transcriptional regulator [Dichotomicrobium thermohalophilum]RIA56075.1 regulatory LuxR family protein [Dichotomicrobium thermohalophilum]
MDGPKPAIPEDTLANWQRIVDLIAKLADVPASLIMRTHAPNHSVLVRSRGEDNPYAVGLRFQLKRDLYCYGVLSKGSELIVENALLDPEWDDNEDLKFGMSFYVGYPLQWPDGSTFGTICVLDRQRNPQALTFREGLAEFARVIEADLKLLCEVAARAKLEKELQRALSQLEERVEQRTQELEEANSALRVLISNLENQRKDYDAHVLRQIKGLVWPSLAKLRSRLAHDPAAATYLDMIEDGLNAISTSRSGDLTTILERLTPAEQEVAQMIMRGLSTKDIARTLAREPSTVEFHRNNIRKKLGLRRSGRNLRSLLLSSQ